MRAYIFVYNVWCNACGCTITNRETIQSFTLNDAKQLFRNKFGDLDILNVEVV